MYQGGLGIDVQRVAWHYGISESEAEEWLTIHPVEMLLSPRGTGLIRGTAAGIGNQVPPDEVPPECPSCWPFLLVGGFFGSILGVSFAMILQKGE